VVIRKVLDQMVIKKRKRRFPSKGGFTRFFKDDEEQRECESLQIRMIDYFDDSSIPFD